MSVANDGETVTFRARVHKTRQQGATMVFLTLRQQSELIQALLKTNKDTDATAVSKQMVKWTGSINLESIVLVEGKVAKVEEKSNLPLFKMLKSLLARFILSKKRQNNYHC